MKVYKARIVDENLKEKLESKGAVVIEGPKWCGKTTTAIQAAASVIRMDDPSKREENIAMSVINPAAILKGDVPRLIDEWQIAPKLWDAARYEIDTRDEEGQFIFTGSAVPMESDEITHSGTGRFTWLTMRTMTLYESGESTGEVSLKELFKNTDKITGTNDLDLEKLTFLICRGGWPKATEMKRKIALLQGQDYYEAVVRSDINRADGISKNPERVKRLMRSLARNQGMQISNTLLKNDMISNDTDTLNEDTIASYINALKNIFVVEDMPAWNPNLRSKIAIRTSDTRYFADPSIAVSALGIGPEDLFVDIRTMGLLFETLCVRDLRVYAESIGGKVFHYRDKSGLECDMVIHLRDGRYALVEVKLGGASQFVEDAVANLKALASKIDTEKMGNEPSFLMVIVGLGSFAYKREDGVLIVPVGCLKN